MIEKQDTTIVTTAPVHIGHGDVPFPPGTQMNVTADHAQHLISEGNAVLAKDWDAYCAEQEHKQKTADRAAAAAPVGDQHDAA